MNTHVFEIVHYIINSEKIFNIDSEKIQSLVKELIRIGYKTKDINMAFQMLGHFINFNHKISNKFLESSLYNKEDIKPDFTAEVLKKVNNFVMLFRELNLINDEKVEKVYDAIQQRVGILNEPDTLVEILEDYLMGDLDIFDIEDFLLTLPLAFRYRKIF